jgi:hypothetical protein
MQIEGTMPLAIDEIGLLVERFAMSRMMPDIKKRFDPDAFTQAMKAHQEFHGVKWDNETVHGGASTVVMEHRPPYDHVCIFLDPRTLGPGGVDPQAWAVFCPSQALELKGRGFIQLALTSVDRNNQLLPAAIPMSERGLRCVSRAAPPSQMPTATPEPAVPSAAATRVPPCNPFVQPFNKGCGTAAEQLVRWMEQKVEHKGSDYSPVRLWSKAARKAGVGTLESPVEPFDSATHRGDFHKRCVAYVHIKHLGLPPSQITKSYTWSTLISEAPKARKRGLIAPGQLVAGIMELEDEDEDEGSPRKKSKGGELEDTWQWAARVASEALQMGTAPL